MCKRQLYLTTFAVGLAFSDSKSRFDFTISSAAVIAPIVLPDFIAFFRLAQQSLIPSPKDLHNFGCHSFGPANAQDPAYLPLLPL